MAEIHNSELTKELMDGAKIQTSQDSVPSALAEKVVPVMEVNPKLLRVCNIVKTNTSHSTTGNKVVYLTPANKDFYLTSATLLAITDVNCDLATGAILLTGIINGVTESILALPNITLTLEDHEISISPKNPIKIDRGTNIQISGAYTAGVAVRIGSVSGYLMEN